MRPVLHLALLLTSALYLPPALALPLAQLPDPRPLHVSDPLDRLTPAEEAAIEAAIGQAQRGELVVVVTDDTEDLAPRAYATRLFNLWALGDPVRDDGVLILAALDSRKSEIVLGKGIDGDTETAITDAVMTHEMVPRFETGDPAGALRVGAEAVATRLLGATPPAAPPPERTLHTDSSPSTPLMVGGVGGSLALGLTAFVRGFLRHRPRKCPRCGRPTERLAEHEDDAHLAPGEQTEEQLGSVDYDVWLCRCGNVEKLRYGALFTRYANCPKCKARARLSVKNTVRPATTICGGLVEVTQTCAHCGYGSTYRYDTPRLADSDSSFGGGSSGGGSSDGGGSSGSW